MVSKGMDVILSGLVKIEIGLSKIYNYLANIESFTPPVRRFWALMVEEERRHAKVFNDTLERAKKEDALEIEIKTDIETLKSFVSSVNDLLADLKSRNISEEEAYSFGADLEARLDEANFLKKLRTNDPGIEKELIKIEHETKKHRMILINYSKGYK